MVAAVNFRFLGKGEVEGGTNHGSRGRGRGEGGPRGRGEGESRGRGEGESSIEGMCSDISAAVTGPVRIVSLISPSRLCMSVRVYPMILS